VKSKVKGSSVPDFFKTGGAGEQDHSIEVKNYNIETPQGVSNLIYNVTKQIDARNINLPQNTKQTIIIDVRGQNLSPSILKEVSDKIINKTNPGIEIIFKEK
jgi:hypothetical protein